jgi:hypothetical protein
LVAGQLKARKSKAGNRNGKYRTRILGPNVLMFDTIAVNGLTLMIYCTQINICESLAVSFTGACDPLRTKSSIGDILRYILENLRRRRETSIT